MALYNNEGGAGAVAAPAAPAPAAPASAPAAAPAAAPSPSPAPAPAPAGAPAATPAAAPAGRLIDSMPERGSAEYWTKFDAMPMEQRRQVEQEWAARDSGADPAPEKKPAAPDPAAAALPGDKPKGEGEVFVDQALLDRLGKEPVTPEDGVRIKSVMETMQKTIDEFSPFMDETVGSGLQVFMADPIIAQRIQEISSGKQWEPGELAKGFNPEAYLPTDLLKELDPISDPATFSQKIGEVLKKAHADGLKQGQTAAQFEMNQKVALAERKSFFDSGFKSLMDKHPELKPSDASLSDIRDARHPANRFVKWAAQNMGDRYFLNPENKMPFESAYAAFLASTGDLDKAIGKVAESTRFKFIRSLKDAQTTAATVGRTTPSAPPVQASPVPGLDVQRYLNDQVYATSFYNNADHATRLKLEQVRYGTLK